MEIDHAEQPVDGGANTIDNAIAVCFECHAEIHSYNDKHPRGRKFKADELRQHKEQWLRICLERPDLLLSNTRQSDVGPLQALIDELEFNKEVAEYTDHDSQGCLFQDEQFRRAIREGAIATLRDNLKQVILAAYVSVGRANTTISTTWNHPLGEHAWHRGVQKVILSISEAKPKIEAARDSLLNFLMSEQ